MAPKMSVFAAVAAAGLASQNAHASSSSVAANPIRRVVTMLQSIQKKVEGEAERDEELHKKFMCYCSTGASDLEKSIADAEAKISDVASSLKEAEASKAQLQQDLAAAQSDRATAKEAIASATAVRDKEAATYAAFKAESDANIKAITGAVAALEKGMAGAFVQTAAAQRIMQWIDSSKTNMLEADREDVTAFLQGSQGEDYAPQSGQITGILKQLGDEMAAGLSEATAAEEASIKIFDELVAAKKAQIQALTDSIEKKSVRLGEVSVEIAELKNEGGDAAESLSDDRKFLADLDKNCKTAQSEYDAIVKTRSEELVALADTIKILNDDDALELFKKTLPSSASFVQVQVSASAVRQRALSAIQTAHQPRLNFIAMALQGKKMGFEKVITMIDDMVALLKTEQEDDNKKKAYCAAEFDSSDDKKKALERSVADSETAIADAEETLSTLASEIKALQKGIKTLDKQVAEATEQRKAENEEFTQLMAENTAAKELIGVAKNRLNKFYNPKLYKAPPKRELTEAERIEVNMGGTLAPTPAPGGIAGTGVSVASFVQISAHTQVDPGPAPEKASYKKSGEESGGVIAMMDLLVKDLDKEMTVADTEEKDAQADYEEAMKDSASKRADDVKTLGDKEAAKADTEAALQAHTDDKASASKELMATMQYISSLHGECDWLLQYFDVREEARSSEIDALGKAKAVLSGADYSLLQTKRSLRGA